MNTSYTENLEENTISDFNILKRWFIIHLVNVSIGFILGIIWILMYVNVSYKRANDFYHILVPDFYLTNFITMKMYFYPIWNAFISTPYWMLTLIPICFIITSLYFLYKTINKYSFINKKFLIFLILIIVISVLFFMHMAYALFHTSWWSVMSITG